MTASSVSIPQRDRPTKAAPPLRMTEEEFVEWCEEDVTAEWVDGEVVVMSPVSRVHDKLTGFLYRILSEVVESRDLGEINGTQYQVRFKQQRRRRLPDLLYTAKSRLDILLPNHAEGAPDLIVEVVSPESVARDWRDKYHEYQTAGVKEYWIIDPMSQRVEAYTLGPEQTYQVIAENEGKIASIVLPGFYLRPAWLWPNDLPKVADALREMGVRT